MENPGSNPLDRKTRLNKWLSLIVNLKPGEEKLVLLLFLCFFLIAAPHTIIKALRYADILTKIGTGALPLAYLLSAVITGLAVFSHSRIHRKVSSQLMITASLVFFIVTGVLLNFLLMTNYGGKSVFLSYFFWVWATVLTIVLITQFWSIINDVFNIREAKRLIGFCGSGGILGGAVGGLLAKFLTQANLANLLLPLACGLLFICLFIVRAIFVIGQKKLSKVPPAASEKVSSEVPKAGFKDTFDAVRKNKYLVLISVLVIITVIVTTFIDFQFSSAVNEKYDSKEAQQAFFGLFYAGLLTFSFFLSLFITSNIFRNFRVRVPLLLSPVVLLLISVGSLFMPFTIILAVLIKGGEESLGFSLNQPVREILYIPVASNMKVKVKPFIDMFISRFAKVLAAIILLIYALTLGQEVNNYSPTLNISFSKDLFYVITAFLIFWVLIGLSVGKEHNRILREKIQVVWPNAYREVKKKLDIDLAKLVVDTIESKNRSSVLYALHLFDLIERGNLTPEIKKMISQSSAETTASSLGDIFNAEGSTWIPEFDDDESPENLITIIKEIVSSDAYQQVMRMHAEKIMEKAEKSETDKMELAKVIGLMSQHAPMVEMLEALISDDSLQVSIYAMRSAARLKKVEHIPSIIQKLSDPIAREDAVNALKEYGPLAMDSLEEYIGNSENDISMRKAAVEALAGIGSQKAVKALLRELDSDSEELEADVIDALDRIRSERADILFPAKLTKKATFSIVRKYCQTYIGIHQLEADNKNAEHKQRMERDLETHFWNIFKLLGLSYPHEDTVKVYQNLKTGTKEAIEDATELLDITLKKKMKGIVLPLIEDLHPTERLRQIQKILRRLDSV